MMKSAIYGAGDFGKRLLEIFGEIEFKIDAFVQSEKSDMIELKNIPVISYDELLNEKEPWLVFIAINNEDIVNSIMNKFEDDGYTLSRVFDMRNFIIDNYKISSEGESRCIMCNGSFHDFGAWGRKNKLFLEREVIGGGYRANAVCPLCGSLDRTRWVYWLLKNQTDIFERNCTVIHFAPEKQLREVLEQSKNCDYYAGDICKSKGVHRLDVTQIPYIDEFADFVIINHVMEHVENEGKAIAELKRVLKSDGKIIMSFPISQNSKTYENKHIVAEEDREKYFGQKDHVRLYGIDFKDRFENYGLRVTVFSPKDYFGAGDMKKYGFMQNDIVLICSK